MISLESLAKSGRARAPIITIYGVSGIGKTTLATSFPDPVVIDIEDGLGEIKVDSFGPDVISSYDDVMSSLSVLATEEHKFKTIVVDSLDWLEPMIWTSVCKENGYKSIESPGYNKGYAEVLPYWREYMDALSYLRGKGMTIIQIAHHKIDKFNNPETDTYDRYVPKLRKEVVGPIIEHSDAVFFANYEVSTVSKSEGFNKNKVRAIGQGDRLLRCQERPSSVAKNRYGMPAELPMDWHAIAEHIEFFNVKKEAA